MTKETVPEKPPEEKPAEAIPASEKPLPSDSISDLEEKKELPNPETISKETKDRVQNRKDVRKAVDDLLELAESEPTYNHLMNDYFWELIRDRAIAKVGLPDSAKGQKIEVVLPLDDEHAREFLKERMDEGQFSGKRLSDLIAKGHTEYLLEFASGVDRFRRKLRRLLARGDKKLIPAPLKPAKPVKKAKPRPKKDTKSKPKAKKAKKEKTKKAKKR